MSDVLKGDELVNKVDYLMDTGHVVDIVDFINEQMNALKQDLLFDLDEIDNKPWRVFRQLAVIMPEYAETYIRYEAFYSYGGSSKVEKLIEAFEKTDDFKESGFPEKIKEAEQKLKIELESLKNG